MRRAYAHSRNILFTVSRTAVAVRPARAAHVQQADMPQRALASRAHSFLRAERSNEELDDAIHDANLALILYEGSEQALKDLPRNAEARDDAELKFRLSKVAYEAKLARVKELQRELGAEVSSLSYR